MKAVGKTRKDESKHPCMQTRALPSRSIVRVEWGKNIWHKKPTATRLSGISEAPTARTSESELPRKPRDVVTNVSFSFLVMIGALLGFFVRGDNES